VKRLQRLVGVVLVHALAGLVILPLLALVEPFRKIRFTHLWCARFGPLAYNTHLFVGNRILNGPEPGTTRVFFGAKPANRPLFEMWKRVIPIVESRLLSAFYHYGGTMLSNTRFFRPLPDAFDDQRPVNVGAVLSFSDGESRRGRALLEEMGLSAGDWFVAFQSRDASYHAKIGKGDSGTHRTCAIDMFMTAAEEVTRRGGFAIRIGAEVGSVLPATGNPRIIDYATRFRKDWADIYLLGTCRFLLSPGTGTVFVPGLFDRPVAQANMLPLLPNPIGRRSLYTTKILRDAQSGRVLTYGELQAMGAYDFNHPNKAFLRFPRELEENGLIAIENAPDEILALCVDMFDRLEGIPAAPEAVRLQQLYNRRFLGGSKGHDLLPDLAPSFALRYRDLIEG